MLRLAFVLAAAPLFLTPAQAADMKTIDCVQKTVAKDVVPLLIADVDKNFANIDNQTYSEATIAGMRAAATICRTKYGWSDKASESSVLYALFNLANSRVRYFAKTAKLDYGKLEARFKSLSKAEQDNAMVEATLNKLATGALDAKEMDETNAKVAGAVFGFLAVRAKALNEFAAN